MEYWILFFFPTVYEMVFKGSEITLILNDDIQNIFALFKWKLLKLTSANVRDIRKIPQFYKWEGSAPAPPTPPVIRVVLLHADRIVQGFSGSTVH